MKILILCMAAVSLCGCSYTETETSVVQPEKPKPIHNAPAPGYGVACDGIGHYTFTWESPYTGKHFIADWKSFHTKQEAIEYGWDMYRLPSSIDSKTLPYDFHECQTNGMEAK